MFRDSRPNRRRALALASCLLPTLGGCGTYVPQQQEVWEGPDITGNMAVDIKKHIFCELVHAIKFVNKNLRINDGPSIPDSYGVQMQITLTVEENSALSAGLVLNQAIRDGTLGLGGNLSSTATRTDTSYSFYNVGKIAGPAKNHWCDTLEVSASSLLMSDLGIGAYLLKAVKAQAELHSSAPAKPDGLKLDVLSYDVKFVVVSNGNVTPSWKLVSLSANSGGSPFLAAGRTRTHDLILTFGPGDPNSPTYYAALQTHFTQQIVQANQRRGN
ncbi:hypothetical protein [Bradyrhizobium canariense]|uniref:hypothetical protein n=1 Tax=Bradyrhizobium canariense TaxID=255045 RepID=UPI0011775E23|nr:hypothetical protein [Bradyrhizobium canariense]